LFKQYRVYLGLRESRGRDNQMPKRRPKTYNLVTPLSEILGKTERGDVGRGIYSVWFVAIWKGKHELGRGIGWEREKCGKSANRHTKSTAPT